MIQAFGGADGEEKKKELGFAYDVENQNEAQNSGLKVLRKAEYLQKKEELRQIKTELKSLKMTEATKDMMKDEAEDPSFDSAQDSFVKLMFTRDQFKTTGNLKDFILRISGVVPQYIDL